MPESVVDDFDLALLELVQRDNLTPARVLAERVGLSESAVLRRLRRLRREKIIAADVSIVRPEAIGLPLTIIALVSLERENAGVLDAFARQARARDEVRQCWYVTGESDLALVLQVESMAAYEAFTREMFGANPDVKAFKTLVAMRQIVARRTGGGGRWRGGRDRRDKVDSERAMRATAAAPHRPIAVNPP